MRFSSWSFLSLLCVGTALFWRRPSASTCTRRGAVAPRRAEASRQFVAGASSAPHVSRSLCPSSRKFPAKCYPYKSFHSTSVLCYHRRYSAQTASRWRNRTRKLVRGKGRTGRGRRGFLWIVCHQTKVRKRKDCCAPSCLCWSPPRTGGRAGGPWPLRHRRPTPGRASGNTTIVSTIIWTICITLSTGAISGVENRTKAMRYNRHKVHSTYFNYLTVLTEAACLVRRVFVNRHSFVLLLTHWKYFIWFCNSIEFAPSSLLFDLFHITDTARCRFFCTVFLR